jgi:hypothetical protein
MLVVGGLEKPQMSLSIILTQSTSQLVHVDQSTEDVALEHSRWVVIVRRRRTARS